MAGSLEGVLADIPGLAGYLAVKQKNEQQTMGNLQKVTGVLSLQGAMQDQEAKRQAMLKAQQDSAREQAYRGALSSLGPEATSEQLVQVASQFAPPATLLSTQTSHLDRQAKLKSDALTAQSAREQRANDLTLRGEQELANIRARAAEGRITKEEADAREKSTREYIARLMAGLRPPPQVQPLVQVMTQDGPKYVERHEAIGKVPAGAGSKAETTMAGKSDVDRDVMTLKASLDQLNSGGGITSTEKGVLPNIGRWASTTPPGQLLGTMGGTHNQKARDVIIQSRPLLLRSIMQSTGMSAKQLDSNAELKLWLSTATDPTKGYEANIEALNNIALKYGSGEFLEGSRTSSGKIQQPESSQPTSSTNGQWSIKKK